MNVKFQTKMTEFPVSRICPTRSGKESYCYDSKTHPGVTYTFIVKDTTRKKLKLCCAACTKVKRKIPSLKAPIIYMASATTFDRDPDGLNHLCTLDMTELLRKAEENIHELMNNEELKGDKNGNALDEDGSNIASTAYPIEVPQDVNEGFPVSRITLTRSKKEAYCYDSKIHPNTTYVFTVKDTAGKKIKLVCNACMKAKKRVSGKVPNLYLLSNFIFDRDPDGLNHICTLDLEVSESINEGSLNETEEPVEKEEVIAEDITAESIFDVIEKIAFSTGNSTVEPSTSFPNAVEDRTEVKLKLSNSYMKLIFSDL